MTHPSVSASVSDPGPATRPLPQPSWEFPKPSWGLLRRPRPAPPAPSREVVLVTDRPDAARWVEAAAASLGADPVLRTGVAALPGRWSTSAVVLLGSDVAAQVGGLSLPRRPDVHVLGAEGEEETLCRLSAELAAGVVVLPRDAPALTRLMRDGADASPATTVAVVGGGGGAGASTTAAGVAGAGRLAGLRTALVDLDPSGGGIDLLLGVEREPGWRWPDLAQARGTVGRMARHLPACEGIPVLSMGRGVSPAVPDAVAVGSVVSSLRADHDLIVLDLPRPGGGPPDAVGLATVVLVVAGPGVRQVAAARAVGEACRGQAPDVRLVVRAPRRGPDLALVAEAVGLAPVGRIPDEPRLPLAAERGDPPWRMAGGGWVAACDGLVRACRSAGR